ncbi:hypothetical protein EHO59_09055 [Leptospira semungkisensis]|uniref:Uncharacterized protein n=1 Tax=Leptospira semungkisensis TaxID=2484985 RepID=A0A4R9G0S8_9LEPT|nr:hypothetical protein [Leptospira semungkisensis]TGK04982.1 hypothetical protein EHO59_09055 [Leptospira semungkisensis]
MIFLSLFRKLAVLFFLILLSNCASPKKQIGEPELKLVLEYLTEARLAGRLNYAAEQTIRSDMEIVTAACERYQLDQDSVMEQIKIRHPEIYSALVGQK